MNNNVGVIAFDNVQLKMYAAKIAKMYSQTEHVFNEFCTCLVFMNKLNLFNFGGQNHMFV